MKRSGYLLAAGLIAVSGAAHSQSCHSLDGQWLFRPAESRVGSGLAFNPHDSISVIHLSIVTQAGGGLTQRWQFQGPHLERTARYLLVTDGVRRATGLESPKDFEYSAIAAEWQNCTLIVHGYSRLFGLEIASTDTYVLSEDGRRLRILRYGESPISITDQQLVFDKE